MLRGPSSGDCHPRKTQHEAAILVSRNDRILEIANAHDPLAGWVGQSGMRQVTDSRLVSTMFPAGDGNVTGVYV